MLLTGSHAKGTAGPDSDLDLVSITPAPRAAYRAWFDDGLHVSAAVKTAAEWKAKENEPARWSLGFPARVVARYVLGDGDDPSLLHPAAEPELEDFVDFVLKSRRCAGAGDEAGARWFAHAAAELVPTLLRVTRVVEDRRDALDAAVSLPVYGDRLAVCLGVKAGEIEIVSLARELLAFLREHDPGVDPQPEIGRYLADGTLERLLEA